jgi:hypothetical protein
MTIAQRLWRFLFPPSRWQGCHAPTAYERLADYERRLGEHKAAQWIRNERIAQVFDSRTSESVRRKFTPKLPSDNVVSIRRKKGE